MNLASKLVEHSVVFGNGDDAWYSPNGSNQDEKRRRS